MCSNHWRCDSVPHRAFIHHVIRPRFNSWNKVSMWCKYIFETVLFAVTFHHKMLILLLNWINKRCQLQLFLWLEFYLQVQILQVIIQCAVYTWGGFHAVACAASFFFVCLLFISFFFSCFCFWMLSWIFCLNFFFWLLIFSSSAFLLASSSGSWNGRKWLLEYQNAKLTVGQVPGILGTLFKTRWIERCLLLSCVSIFITPVQPKHHTATKGLVHTG